MNAGPKSGTLQVPVGLPATFTYTQARRTRLSDRRLYRLRDAGLIEQIGRGLYQRIDDSGTADRDLVEIAHRVPRATLCLVTALARHDLTDIIPARIDVALPRGHRHPRVQSLATWHSFAVGTFDLGRDEFVLDGRLRIGLYQSERCIVDAFRLRHQEGDDIAVEALRRWLRRRGAQPTTLLAMARHFPKAEPALRAALQVLL